MKTVYGPVPSWRFGRSLGVDPVCRMEKICPFDCVYCQLGRTKRKTLERAEYVGLERVCGELGAADRGTSDVITFSGTSEPTLNVKIGEMIGCAKEFGLPVVVLTNSSLLHLREVREALCKADVVSAKLDAPNDALFQKINRPAAGITFESVFGGLEKFREEFGGKFALQMMFVGENKDAAGEMAELARRLKPDEVQLDTPLRPSAVPPLSPAEMEEVGEHFGGLPFISVYKEKKPEVAPLDLHETRARRPEGES